MTKESSKYDETLKTEFGESVKTKTFDNPFYVSPEMQQVIAECRDENFDAMQDKLVGLLREHHDQEFIQFLTDKGTGMQIGLKDWAKHLLTRTADQEPWLIPEGSRPALVMNIEKFVRVGEGEYVHRNPEAEKLGHVDYGLGDMPGIEGVDGKQVNVASLDLYINGEKYDQPPLEIEIDQQRLRDRVRQGVIDDLRQQWGSNTTQALDDQGRVVTLTVEQVADMAMQSHYEQGMKDLNQPFSKRPAEQDIRTIYGKSASDMYGKVTVNGVEKSVDRHGNVVIDDIQAGIPINVEYDSGLGREWRPENVLRRSSKTVYKPVRKVSLREKARAQRRARRKSR